MHTRSLIQNFHLGGGGGGGGGGERGGGNISVRGWGYIF